MSNSKVIRHSDNELAVNLEWVYIDPSIKLNKFVANAAHERGASFAYYNKHNVAFGSEAVNGKPVLAQIISESLNPVKAIVFLKLDSELNDFGKDQYWLCAYDEKGRVVPASDLVLTEEGVRDNLFDPTYEGFDLYTTSESVEDESNYNIFSFDDVIHEYASNKAYFVKSIATANKKKNRVVVGSLVAAICVGLYFTVFQVDPLYEQLKNGDFNPSAASSKGFITKVEKKYDLKKSKRKRRGRSRGASELTEESIKKIAEDDIFTRFSNTFYSNNEIFSNLLGIINAYPNTVLGWDLEKVVYDRNSFFFNYVKKEENDKSFRDLDVVVNELTKSANLISQPSQLLDSGNNRLYEVVFNSSKRDEMIKRILEKNKKEQKKKEIFERIKKLISSIKGYQSSVYSQISSLDEMGWVSKRFGDTLENMQAQIELDDKSIKRDVKKLKDLSKEYDKLLEESSEVAIDQSWLNGDVLSLVNLMQKNAMLEWSYPSKEITIPSANIMDKSSFPPYAKYWEILISGGDADPVTDEVPISRLGAALYLFDMSNTIVNTVIIQNKTKEFEIKGEYYEKIK